jgi:fluoride exporter
VTESASPRDGAPGDAWRASRFHGTARDPRVWLAVAVGGACGGALRTALEDAHPAGSGWPWVTLAVNLAGVALLALVAVRLTERVAPTTYPRPFLGTGLCGGLTTFSTLQVEVVRLARDDRWATAGAYLAATLAGGVLVVFLVARLARRARWRA